MIKTDELPQKREADSEIPAALKKKKTKDSKLVSKFTLKPQQTSPCLSDIHNLLLWILSETRGTMPKWVFVQNKNLINQVVLLFLPGLDLCVLNQHSDHAPFLSALTKRHDISTVLRHGKRQINGKYIHTVIVNQKSIKCKVDHGLEKIGIEGYLMTENQLIQNNYEIQEYEGWVTTGNSKNAVPIIALDCEMVRTQQGLELARVSIVDADSKVIYDKYVKPSSQILDYLTPFSGITPEILENINITLPQVQQEILGIVSSDTIICGHSLENDLRVLKLIHYKIIDTSIIYPHPTLGFKYSLKSLAAKYLRKNIQNGSHDSGEDAIAALELVTMKLCHGPSFGVPDIKYIDSNLFEDIAYEGKKSVMVGIIGKNELIAGNLSVDYSGRIDKYFSKNYALIVSEWREIIENKSFQNRERDIPRIISEWDTKLKELVRNAPPNTAFMIMSGEGDVHLAAE